MKSSAWCRASNTPTAALQARVGGGDTRPEGVVTVAMPDFLAATLIAPVMDEFVRLYPDLTLEVQTGHRFLNLARGEADMALRNRPPDHHSLVARRLGTVAIGLYATPGYIDAHPVVAGDYRGHRMILFDDMLQPMPGIRALEDRLQGASVVLRSSDLPMMMLATASGAAIGCFPTVLAHGRPDLVAVAPIVGLPEVFLSPAATCGVRRASKAVGDFIARRWLRMAAAISGRAVAEQFGDGAAGAQPSAAQAPRPA